MKKYLIKVLLVISTSILLLGCGEKKNNGINIGSVVVMSGSSALWGQMAQKGISIVLDDYNLDKAANEKINVIYEDSKGEPSSAISALNKLISADNVQVVLGDMLSSTTLAMAPVANKNKVVLIGISCSAPAITEAGPYIYRVWPSDLYEGEALAKWAINQSLKRISIIYLKNDYGEGLKDAFANTFVKLGGTIKGTGFFTDQEQNYRNIITKVVNGVDAIYIVGYYENTALIIRQIREINQNVKILGTSSAENEALIKIAGKAAEGFIYPLSSDWDLQKLNNKQEIFRDKFVKKYKVEPDWAAVHGADAVLVAIDALQHAKTGPQIKAYIDKEKNFDGITGKITFDENGDVINKPITFKTVKNGQFVDFKR